MALDILRLDILGLDTLGCFRIAKCDTFENEASTPDAKWGKHPIRYASRSLLKAERKYPQLEKEDLACIFGVKRFHSYLFGHHFHLITDHKPLLALVNEHRSTSPQASARIRRWSLFLSSYEYSLSFRDTQSHSNADALSRLPLPIAPEEDETLG